MCSDMKYLPIGTKISYDDVELVVVAQDGNKPLCTGCYFSNYVRTRYRKAEFSCYVHGMACTKHLRKDRKHVIFKPI